MTVINRLYIWRKIWWNDVIYSLAFYNNKIFFDDLSNAIYNICGGSGKADFSEVLFLCMKMIASCK